MTKRAHALGGGGSQGEELVPLPGERPQLSPSGAWFTARRSSLSQRVRAERQERPLNIVDLQERALDETARLIDGLHPDQMALPTPCAAWDVRALLAHLIGGNLRWAALAQGEALRREPARGEGPRPDLLGDDPAGAYRRSATLLAEAWQDPALLDQSFELPVGVMAGRAALGVHLVETVAHAWDLARATGQQLAFDPDVVEAAARFAHSRVPRERPPGAAFAPPVPVADDLPAIERFAAYLGRTP